MTPPSHVPLCVDLDGTLIYSDVSWESVARLLKRQPSALLQVPFWCLGGRAGVKRRLADRVSLDAARLPYHSAFVAYLRDEKARGRRIFLATASDLQLANTVSAHLGFFDGVLASDGKTNLRGAAKAEALVARFGEQGFDYAGDSAPDLKVWPHAREALLVNATRPVARQARTLPRLGKEFPGPADRRLHALFRALRPHQWAKNLIVLVPLLTSHQIFHPAMLVAGMKAFVAFCLCASATYLVNDLCDLDADRSHAVKHRRPLASGELPVAWGLALAPVLLLAGLGFAAWASWPCLAVLLFYSGATLAYSWRLKEIAIIDVFVLAGLYTLRLIAGHFATHIEFSAWLLAFSMFIFLSLALVKRHQELLRSPDLEGRIHGRGYFAGDRALMLPLGTASGYLAVLVLALYVSSDQVLRVYRHSALLLLICPFFLYWISRVWLVAHRGKMHDDPVVFALKDKQSYLVGLLALLIIYLAS